jgi:hypothetical protein
MIRMIRNWGAAKRRTEHQQGLPMTKTNRFFTATLLASTALVASLGLAAEPASAGSIKNNSPLELTVGGQLNRAFLYVNDGEEGMYRHVDNENASSRIFLNASGTINADWSVGTRFEMLMRSNPSNSMSATAETAGTSNFEEEAAEVFFTHKRLGTLFLGQGDTATNGISETDLSGTGVAGYSSVGDVAGGFAFVTSSTGARSTATIGGSADNLDGLNTADRIRYDSPEINGFHLSTSLLSGGAVDAALYYAGNISGVAVEAAAGWYNTSSNPSNESTFENGFSGSVSAMLASGFNLTLAAGTKSSATQGRDDPKFYYAKVGYQANLNSFGPSAFAIDFGRFEDSAQNGDTLDTFGAQAVQEIEGTGSSVYVAYRYHTLDRSGTDFDAIHSIMTGAYVAF